MEDSLAIYKGNIVSPLGFIWIVATDTRIKSISFSEERFEETESNEILDSCKNQLIEYFNGNRKAFNLSLEFSGTDFQNKVWEELLNIPFAKTRSYIEIAQKLGDPKVIRAAASANGANPFSIVVPCHRVIGKDGSLTGYASGLWRKKWLLEFESGNKQLDLFE